MQFRRRSLWSVACLLSSALYGRAAEPGPLAAAGAMGEVWGKRPETGFDLVWEPTFAAMSRGADFGYDTAPAKWRGNKTEEKFLESNFSHYGGPRS